MDNKQQNQYIYIYIYEPTPICHYEGYYKQQQHYRGMGHDKRAKKRSVKAQIVLGFQDKPNSKNIWANK